MTNLTTKSTREVVLEPLDDSGRRFVVYGLREEQVKFRIRSPSKRNVAASLLTQQRRMERKRYTLNFLIFEPNQRADGTFSYPDTSGIYEGTIETGRLTSKQQLDLVDELAKLNEEGVLLRYSGLAAELPRCAIKEFDASVIRSSGQGTLVIEERPEQPVDVSEIAIRAVAFEEALKLSPTSGMGENTEDAMSNVKNGTVSRSEYLAALRSMLLNSQDKVGRGVYTPTTEGRYLDRYGLVCLPITTSETETEVRQILPADSSNGTPTVSVLPFDFLVPTTRAAGRASFELFGPDFSVDVIIGTYVIRFDFNQEMFGAVWNWTASVYEQAIPTADPRDDTNQAAPCDDKIVAIAKPSDAKIKPLSVLTGKVVYGQEFVLAHNLHLAFVGQGGSNPFAGRRGPLGIGEQSEPRGSELKAMAMVFAEYG